MAPLLMGNRRCALSRQNFTVGGIVASKSPSRRESSQLNTRLHGYGPGMLCRKCLNSQPGKWQGQQGLNPRPTVLETVALPAELYPYADFGLRQVQEEVKGFSRPPR